MLGSPIRTALLALVLLSVGAGAAQAVELTARAGTLTYTNSRSYALSHLTDPVVDLEVTFPLSERLDLGVCASHNFQTAGLGLGGEETNNYSLLGMMMVVRTPVIGERSSPFRLLLGWGAGFGSGPRILSTDLSVGSDLTAWQEFSLEARWRVSGPLTLGTALGVRQLSVLATTVSAGWAF